MRAVVITKHGGPGVLRGAGAPRPELGPGEVRIEVAAAGINFADVMARMGLYPDAPKTPCVVGYEVAGTILELGEGVDPRAHARPARARGHAVRRLRLAGGRARRTTSSRCRTGSRFEQGAAIPVNYGTAWAGLIGYGNLQPGERVLIHSAGGGVGIAATQIAKRAAPRSTAPPRPASTRAATSSASTTRSTTPRAGWERGPAEVRRDPRRHRRQAASGAATTLLRPGGRLVAFGASAVVSGRAAQPRSRRCAAVARMPRFNMIKQMSESKAVIGLNMLSLWKDRGTLRAVDRAAAGAARRRHRQTGRGGRVQLRGGRRGAEDDHRAAQRRQGRARTALTRAARRAVRIGANLRRRCRSQLSLLSLLLLPPRGE